MCHLYKEEQYSVFKTKKSLSHATTRMSCDDIVLSKPNRVTKGQIPYDFISMGYREQSKSWTWKVEWWLPEAGGQGKWGVVQ